MKKKLFYTFCYCFCFAASSICHAQRSDTLRLNEVPVTPRLSDFSSTHHLHKIDTLIQNSQGLNNIGQLLQNENSVFIKSYGPSSIATASIRGGNAGQTAVTWNGMSLRNPMLGETDLSILSTLLTDNIQVQHGGSTAMWGSGSVAGTIHLRNEAKFNGGSEASVLFNNGSFRNNGFALLASYSEEQFATSTRLLQKNGLNDFPIKTLGGEWRNQSHAAYTQYGILHEDHLRIKNNQLLTFRYWAQTSDRDLPPTLQQTISRASQHDEFNRLMFEWQLTKEKWKLMLRNGFFYEKINYTDSLINLFGHSIGLTNNSEAEFIYRFNLSSKLQAGINNTFCQAKSDGYSKTIRQNYLAMFAGYLLESKNGDHKLTINVREEYTRNSLQPFTASIAFRSSLFRNFELKGSVNKLYRLPTFNNLYWNPGGNINLKPEDGYSEDLSLKFSLVKMLGEKSSLNVEVQGAVFNRVVSNWIIWLPGAYGIWSPQNLLRVWSRGAETNSSITYLTKKISAKLYLITNYIRSTNQQKKTENDESEGMQLIYTPMYSGAAGLVIKYSGFYCLFNQAYNGYRYLTADNYEFLGPYQVSNLTAGYIFSFPKWNIDLNFSVLNLFNEEYMIMSQRPMPGANYMINLKLTYKHKK